MMEFLHQVERFRTWEKLSLGAYPSGVQMGNPGLFI